MKKVIDESGSVFFNGTCRKYEEEAYSYGTTKLLNDLNNC